tara:strand:- start:662 stop:895 length:234 start_codon:yes stop_codon:yes gene_type:complete
MMTKRHKGKPELKSAQTDVLIASVIDLHEDVVPLLCQLKPQSEHCNAFVDLNAALARAIRKVSGDEPEWMQARVSRQ